MSPLPDEFLDHLQKAGYHPRSSKHSDALALAIVHDLLRMCPALASKARSGQVVFELNFDLHVRTATWNVDLVLGRAASPDAPHDTAITRTAPSTVEIAIELKSVMTEHRKAVKNRKRDLEAHHEHVHSYGQRTIAGGVLLVNHADRFKSPLRSGVTTHGRGDRRTLSTLIAHCISEIRNVTERADATGFGLDAKCAIVVDMDNINIEGTRYYTGPPAPQAGDPLNYDAFLQKTCNQYTERFAGT